MNKALGRTLGGLLVAAAVAAPVAAQAVSAEYSYNGGDYSTNTSSGKTIRACDVENDGHATRAEFVKTGTTSVDSISDSSTDGSCASTISSSVVYKHRSVEVIGGGRDAYGAWVYPK